ncbi:S-layer homology domain-containing protein, partial [Arcticibacter sp.]|uniref:S-layer homology domain-containing protein n=1 Tax=Arcticibacter sp. TaxID=1872630 RepID=UPI00388DE697
MLVILLIATFLFPTVGNAADMTTQEKYDALAAKGIFAGFNGEAALDENMSRAQFARVAALILGLEGIGATDTKVVTEKPFSDVELGLWYTEEIAAAKEAGVFVGNSDGTFNPKGDISVQELAVVLTGLLGLEPVEGATVEGAADWAAGYVKALQDAKVDFPTNYTEPATRAQLASLSFQADAVIAPQRAEEEAKKKAEEEAKKKAEEEAK